MTETREEQQVEGKDIAAEWAERVARNHQASVERGEHDEQCEFDPGGFYLCHCSKRQREAAGFTEPPIDHLDFPPPDCPRCGEELIHEEGWDCGKCSLSWDPDGAASSARFTDIYGDDLAADAERWRSKRWRSKQPTAPNPTEAD